VAPSIGEKNMFFLGSLADVAGKHTLFIRPYKYILKIHIGCVEEH
jgi:hypothetical protein